jgi:hypothetical protein
MLRVPIHVGYRDLRIRKHRAARVKNDSRYGTASNLRERTSDAKHDYEEAENRIENESKF